MKKRLLCLLLCLALLLTGCANVNFGGYFSALGQMMGLNTHTVTKFSDMTYTHPDMDALQDTLDAACDTAANGKDLQAVLRGILDYYDAYDRFYTNYYLADIYYCADLRDSYWADEYAYCGSNASTADAGLETLYRALAQSPYRSELEGDDYFGADYFTAYDGEAFYDETLLDLFQQESDLISDYYAQNDEAAQADTEEAYYTTYVPAMEEAQDYLAAIQSQLGPIYAQVRDLDTGLDAPGKEADTVAYVASAAKAMGGTIQDAYTLLDKGHLYDLTPSAYKYNSSFEIYLDSYAEPFIFVCPTETVYDKLTFIHEFGHFANDYASGGASNSVDGDFLPGHDLSEPVLCRRRRSPFPGGHGGQSRRLCAAGGLRQLRAGSLRPHRQRSDRGKPAQALCGHLRSLPHGGHERAVLRPHHPFLHQSHVHPQLCAEQ